MRGRRGVPLSMGLLLFAVGLSAAFGDGTRIVSTTRGAFAAAPAAQEPLHAHGDDAGDRAAPVPLPVAIDGATEPERIPDELALQHFLMTIAVPRRPSREEMMKRDLFLGRIELAAYDRAAVLDALANVREQLDTVAAERKGIAREALVSVTTLAQVAALKQRERDILDRAVTRVRNGLSPDGVTRLDRHVREHVKRRIVIYGESPW